MRFFASALGRDQPLRHGQRLLRVALREVQLGQRLQRLAVVGFDPANALVGGDRAARVGDALAVDVAEAQEDLAQRRRLALDARAPQVHLARVAPRLLVPEQLGQAGQRARVLGLLLQDRVQLGARARAIAQRSRQQLGAREPQRRHLERVRRRRDARRERGRQRRRVRGVTEQRAQLLERALVPGIDLQHRAQQRDRPAPVDGDPRRIAAVAFCVAARGVLGQRGGEQQGVNPVLGHAQAGRLRLGRIEGQRQVAAPGDVAPDRARRRKTAGIHHQRRAPVLRGARAIARVVRQPRAHRVDHRERDRRLLLREPRRRQLHRADAQLRLAVTLGDARQHRDGQRVGIPARRVQRGRVQRRRIGGLAAPFRDQRGRVQRRRAGGALVRRAVAQRGDGVVPVSAAGGVEQVGDGQPRGGDRIVGGPREQAAR